MIELCDRGGARFVLSLESIHAAQKPEPPWVMTVNVHRSSTQSTRFTPFSWS